MIAEVGNSSSGHVCHSPQHSSSPVYVSSFGASSTGNRCSVTRLAGEVDVHVFTVHPAQQSHSESQDHLEGRSDTRSLLRLCVDHPCFFLYRRATLTTGICLEWQAIPSAHMQHCQVAGFSREVSRLAAAPRRPSTNKMYDDRWLRFANWPIGQGFDLLGPTAAAQIAAFLYDLFDTLGLSPQTIKGYMSCLASVLSRTGRTTAVQAKAISDMIMSFE